MAICPSILSGMAMITPPICVLDFVKVPDEEQKKGADAAQQRQGRYC
jgi:hypothetical protein